MSQNPYATPQAEPDPPSASVSRRAAQICLRIAVIILLVPGMYNYYCFDALVLVGNSIPTRVLVVYRIVNIVGIQLLCVGVWFFGLPILMLMTKLAFSVFGRASKIEDWNNALFAVVKRMPWFAFLGAILWFDWVFAYYSSENPDRIMLIRNGILAHLLAAVLYLPLFYRWYRIERDARSI